MSKLISLGRVSVVTREKFLYFRAPQVQDGLVDIETGLPCASTPDPADPNPVPVLTCE